jgi:hypothetical protein
MKRFCAVICVTAVLVSSLSALGAVRGANQEPNDQISSEQQEAFAIAMRFSEQLVTSEDIGPLVDQLYREGFIRRFEHPWSNGADEPPDGVFIAPGIDVSSRLLNEAGDDDWKRFYKAANNFLLLGLLTIAPQISEDSDDLEPTDMYPQEVISMLNDNPNLANMIVRKERPKEIASVKEMREAAATLEQAIEIIRRTRKGKPPVKIKGHNLIELVKNPKVYKVDSGTSDENFGIDLPKGTRIFYISTPVFLTLFIARIDGDYKIIWTQLVSD